MSGQDFSTIYSPKCYYQRINTFIKQYRPTVKSRISKEDINAFVKSVWKIGILSRARILYWKLILKTLFTKIKALPIAVELAIFGLHYERFSQKILAN